jgi:hypothetical protein
MGYVYAIASVLTMFFQYIGSEVSEGSVLHVVLLGFFSVVQYSNYAV